MAAVVAETLAFSQYALSLLLGRGHGLTHRRTRGGYGGVFIQDRLVAAALLYAQELGMEREDYLLPSSKGSHITKQRADQIIKLTAHKAVQNVMSTPTVRHGYAVNFLPCKEGCDG